MKPSSVITAAFLSVSGYLAAQQDHSTTTNSAENKSKRVVFAQSCFWTGEMKLGQIDGVLRTEAGYFKGREVTLVEYAPERIALEDLVRQAKRAGVADAVYLESGTQQSLAGVPAHSLDGSYRAAPSSDQKKQIEGTPFSRLQLTPEQATKVNAFVREDRSKALGSLTPQQRDQLNGGH